MMGVMKDTGGQQSRFKWMMEGHSPAPSPPDTTLHKNGAPTDGLSNYFCKGKKKKKNENHNFLFSLFFGTHIPQAVDNLVETH